MGIQQRNYRAQSKNKSLSHMEEVYICFYVLSLTAVSDWTDGDHRGTRKLNTETGVSLQALNRKVWARIKADVCRGTGHGIVTANEMMLQFKGPVRTIISLQDKS